MVSHSLNKEIRLDSSPPVTIMITGVQFHSAKVKPGDLFVAIPGAEVDGHDYIEAAVNASASAVVGEQDLSDLKIPYFPVVNARRSLADIANQFFDYPSRRHIMIGITGTNGKTTTSHMLRHILESAGFSCSVIGTVSNRINGRNFPATQTTPDALQLSRLLNESRDEVVIMEVSSHGIDQERVSAMEYDFVVFTNLSHDHLNYHNSMEQYFHTKASLFTQLKSNGEAIVTSLCEWGNGSPYYTGKNCTYFWEHEE